MTGKLLKTSKFLLACCCCMGTALTASAQEPFADAGAGEKSDRTTASRPAANGNAAARSNNKPGTMADLRNVRIAKEVRGLVSDSSGPIPGVTISVKGKESVGTTTDLNGKYILSVPDEASILIVSMVGYDKQEIPVRNREVINVVLKRSTKDLDDVVVVAYGKQKKKEVVGSVTSITPEELKVPSSNLTTALAGRLAGVIGYQRSGEPGRDNAEFFIRGVTTFGYKQDPLILIDNVEYTTEELARLQPDDIASFNIMKDATATALYGARGANGVILVTTKEGKSGKPKFNVRAENTWSMPTKMVDFADPITYMKLENEANRTRDNLFPPYSQEKIEKTEKGVNPLVFPAIDWQDMLFKKVTTTQRYNASVSGGGGVATYYVSGALNVDNGLLKVDKRQNFNNNIDLKTYILRSNVNINVTKTTEIKVRLNGQFREYKGPLYGGNELFEASLRANPVRFPAWFPVDADHKGTQHIMFGNDGSRTPEYVNLYAEMVRGYKDESRSLMLAQVEATQILDFVTPGLSFKALMNTNRRTEYGINRSYVPFYYRVSTYDKYTDKYTLSAMNPDNGTDYLDYNGGSSEIISTFNFQGSLNYTRLFKDRHQVSGLLVMQALHQQENTGTDLQASLPSRNLTFSGRATYGLDNKYFAEFNFGYNGSERFHEKERFGFFPSAGVAWYVSNEKFFDKLNLPVSKLKLRGTYGFVGNDAIGDKDARFFYLSKLNMRNSALGYEWGTTGATARQGISIDRYDNLNVTWEKAAKSNIALELGLWNQLEIIAEYFTERRSQILMNRALPASMGLQGAAPQANVGKARSSGVDISANYTPKTTNAFTVNFIGNFTFAKNRFDVYEEPQYPDSYLSRVGRPMKAVKGYIAERLFVDDAEVANSPRQDFGGTLRGGDIKYRDVNGDGQITVLDQVFIGHPTSPEITFGFGFATSYKSWDLSIFFQGNARVSFWLNPAAIAPFIQSGGLQTQLMQSIADDHWSEENRNLYAFWPRLDPQTNANNSQVSTWWMRDGSYMRLETLEFGYTLPKKFSNRAKITNARIYVTGNNLLIFSKFKTWDAEMANKGLEYPLQRQINLGLNLNF